MRDFVIEEALSMNALVQEDCGTLSLSRRDKGRGEGVFAGVMVRSTGIGSAMQINGRVPPTLFPQMNWFIVFGCAIFVSRFAKWPGGHSCSAGWLFSSTSSGGR